MTTRPATRREDRGRGHRYFLDDVLTDGVTWVLDNGVPKPALIGWAANVTADYATDHWDELAEMRVSERNAVLRRCRWEDKDAAARRGSEVHDFARRLALGQDVDVPDAIIGHVDSYLRFVEDWQPRELLTEAVVGNRRRGYMGTLDLVAQLADGKVWLLDWKTGGKGIYREAALQLAAYRHAEFFINDLGTETPMPQVDAAGCVWLRADGYDLVPVVTDEEVFRVFLHAKQVARFTSGEAEDYVGVNVTPPERTAAA